MRRLAGLLAVGFVGLSGCVTTSYLYTQTRSSAAAKAPNCDLEIISTVPNRPYQELGVFEPEQVNATNIATFRQLIQEQACRAGADAVVAMINGYGGYVKGVAIKYTEASK